MIKKSKRAASTVFYVPLVGREGAEGAQFIGHLKRYLNKGAWRVSVRGRNEDRKGVEKASGVGRGAYHQDLPLDKASYAAVYLDRRDDSPLVTVRREWYDWANKEINSALSLLSKHLTGRTYHSLDDALRNMLQTYVSTRDNFQEATATYNKGIDEWRERTWNLEAEVKQYKTQAFEALLATAAAREPSWARAWTDVKKLLTRWWQ